MTQPDSLSPTLGGTPRARPVRREQLAAFSRAVGDPTDQPNLHTSTEVAQAAGFRDVVIDGRALVLMMSQFLAAETGGWGESGRIAVRFKRPLLAGDTLVPQATAGPGPEGQTRYELLAVNQHGDVVLVGEAGSLSHP
jgi:acyl dehydratase